MSGVPRAFIQNHMLCTSIPILPALVADAHNGGLAVATGKEPVKGIALRRGAAMGRAAQRARGLVGKEELLAQLLLE